MIKKGGNWLLSFIYVTCEQITWNSTAKPINVNIPRTYHRLTDGLLSVQVAISYITFFFFFHIHFDCCQLSTKQTPVWPNNNNNNNPNGRIFSNSILFIQIDNKRTKMENKVRFFHNIVHMMAI